MSKPTPNIISEYKHHISIPTRWNDNDIYGHMNNAIYYFFFDTVVNQYLIESGLLELGKSDTVGLVVETSCAYFAPISFPDIVIAGLRVIKIGTSSVRYEIGLFRNNESDAAAQGHFIHVYVDEKTRRPVKISDKMRKKLTEIVI